MVVFDERRFAQELRNFLSAGKELIVHGNFLSERKELFLKGNLKVNSAVDKNYQFRVKCYKEYPDSRVTLQLERILEKKFHAFIRIEWKPLTSHNNNKKEYMKNIADADDIPKRIIKSSHIHTLEDNLSSGIVGLKAGLPIARPLLNDPKNWKELIKLSSNLLNIKNLDIMGKPPWSERLI